jgi:hypothetical protein
MLTLFEENEFAIVTNKRKLVEVYIKIFHDSQQETCSTFVIKSGVIFYVYYGL